MKLGDYELNQIYNEDSYQAIKKIPDKSIDCIYTDIPYEFISGKGGGFMQERIGRMRNEELVGLDRGIDLSIYDEFIRIQDKINIFIWLNKYQIQETLNYFLKYGVLFEILVWAKDNPIPMTSNVWLSDLEYCLYFRSKGFHLNDGYELKSKWYSSPINKLDKDEYKHPTIKPLELVKRHIAHATQPNDIVADFFLGSGTTCVAAKELGRRYIGFEIDKCYYNIAVDRLNGINANGQTSIFTDFETEQKEMEI